MNTKLRNILAAVLAAAALICLSLGITACGKVTLKDITVENNKVEFLVGDEFTLGDGFTVYAEFSDGTRENVTEEAEIRKENGFDMNVAGDYQITVSYMGKKVVYTIYVGTFNNILLRIDLDTQNVKKQYKLGESISFDNIKVTSTFKNAQGNEVTSVASGLKDFNVTVQNDESGNTTEEILQEFGDFTVTVSKAGIKASYKINVDGVDISTVQGAVITGSFFKDKIVSGEMLFKSKLSVHEMVDAFNSEYTFGDNYTYVKEKIEQPSEYFMSMDDEGFFCARRLTGAGFVFDGNNRSAMMNGPKILLWYNNDQEFGAENALLNLYTEARQASNKDLVETSDEATKTYSFSFSGLVGRSNNRPDYYENEVSFTLSENYSIKQLKFTQKEWENDQALYHPEDPDNTYQPTFYIDPETGFTSPRKLADGSVYRPSSTIVVEINQKEGERTETNPYKREDFIISSFDVSYNGEVLPDNAVINCDMKDGQLKLQISNVLPELAGFDVDKLFFNYEGSHLADEQYVNFEGLNVYAAGNTILVNLRNGGVWTIYLKTKAVTKTITFNVKGVAPDTMTAKLRNDATGAYYSESEKTISPGGEVYFLGEVNQYANPEQSAVIISANADKATVEKTVVDGRDCFRFTATETGVYTVRVYSDVAQNVGCTFTFTVSDIPDYANILKGKYTVKDRANNILELAFTPSGESNVISGTFIYTETPTKGGEPVASESKTETYSYTVDVEKMIIEVKHVSGEDLQILLSVNAKGNLVLTDAYDMNYELTPTE